MKSKTEMFLHNLKTKEITGPYSKETGENYDDLCQAIEDLSLPEGDWIVTEHVTEVSECDFRHTLDMWRYKQKNKKKQDIEAEGGEITKGLPKIITGEVVG